MTGDIFHQKTKYYGGSYISQLSTDTPERQPLRRAGIFPPTKGPQLQETPTESIRTVGSYLELEYPRGGQVITRRVDVSRKSMERLL